MSIRVAIPCMLILCGTTVSMANEIDIKPGSQTENFFESKVERDGKPQKSKLPYLLYAPKDYEPDSKKPALLFLHGYGESGNGNFELLKKHGPPKLIASGKHLPFVTISPQCPNCPPNMEKIIANWNEDQLVDLLDHVASKVSIDPKRVYVTGLSMGGFGTWRLVARHADRIAAAIPICGGGRIEWTNELKGVPIWAFHGGRDNVVTLSYSKSMIDAIQAAGGDVKLTVYPKGNHDSWTRTYNNTKIYDWLLTHQRK